jgi:succinyl-diaminopimelate desuccinylase
MEKQISEKIDGYRDYAIELETGLTAIPAISPDAGGQGELDKMLWLETELKKLKFDEMIRVDCPDPRAKGGVRPNLIARYKGQSSAKTLWIMSHIDVVPPGEMRLWNGDPYKVRVEGDKIYGRGVEDNQQGLVSGLLAVRGLMDAGVRPPCDVALLFNADEETGSKYGAEYVLKARPELFGKDDMFIVPDAGEPSGKLVEVAEKSMLWLKVRTSGRQCHGSTPNQGNNAFKAASELVFRFGTLYRKFNAKDKVFEPKISTFEPTKKEANVPNINTIPGDDVFYMDCRVLPTYNLDDIMAGFRAIADEVEKKHGVKISFETVQREQAAPATSADSEVVRLLLDGIKKVYGCKAKPKGIGGGTVAAIFRRAGFPAVVYSRFDETAHMPNEYCILPNLLNDAKVFARVALSMKA